MRRPLLLAALAAAAIAAGCVTAKVERDSQLPRGPVWRAELAPGPGQTLHGSVTVVPLSGDGRDADSRSRVMISLAGSANGAVHAWHVHYGACGSDGAIVGRARAYPPIPIGAAGAVQMQVEMPWVLNPGVRYFVHIHDAAGMGVGACGALRPEPATQVVAAGSEKR
jgi:hypothetical protein